MDIGPSGIVEGKGFGPNTPEILYHYTTLESLALILKNRTFLFRKLSHLNDPLEGKNNSFKQAEQLVFSSSWTASQVDTIPMWKIYAGLDGLRIGMPRDLFLSQEKVQFGLWPLANRKLHTGRLEQAVDVVLKREGEANEYRTPLKLLAGPDCIKYVTREAAGEIGEVFFHQEVYPDEERTEPRLHLAQVGLTKSEDWAFEQEWRFRIPYCMDMTIVDGDTKHIADMPLPKEDQIFVPFDVNRLDKLEILTGPQFTAGQEILLERLCAKYSPDAVISKSEIEIR